MKNKNISYIGLQKLLRHLSGLKIWDVRASDITGSIFSFEIGAVNEVVNNPDRSSEGEFSFMVYCSWRLEDKNYIITTWRDSSEQLIESLRNINEDHIDNINLSPKLDIEFSFVSGKKLIVFCDFSNSSNSSTNWFLRRGMRYYSANNKFEIEKE